MLHMCCQMFCIYYYFFAYRFVIYLYIKQKQKDDIQLPRERYYIAEVCFLFIHYCLTVNYLYI